VSSWYIGVRVRLIGTDLTGWVAGRGGVGLIVELDGDVGVYTLEAPDDAWEALPC